ncbi:hypothetical protein FB451DRAFT_594195 [Mycena latifolia]|nr:hypothetical protein FB451DRAFT_594195 [Mycena latifolia]
MGIRQDLSCFFLLDPSLWVVRWLDRTFWAAPLPAQLLVVFAGLVCMRFAAHARWEARWDRIIELDKTAHAQIHALMEFRFLEPFEEARVQQRRGIMLTLHKTLGTYWKARTATPLLYLFDVFTLTDVRYYLITRSAASTLETEISSYDFSISLFEMDRKYPKHARYMLPAVEETGLQEKGIQTL